MVVTNITAKELTNAFNKTNRMFKYNLRIQTEVANKRGKLTRLLTRPAGAHPGHQYRARIIGPGTGNNN